MYEVMLETQHVFLGNVSRTKIMDSVVECATRNSTIKSNSEKFCYTRKETNGYLIRVWNKDKDAFLSTEEFICDISKTLYNKVDLLVDKMFLFDGREGYYCDNFIISPDKKGVVYNLK